LISREITAVKEDSSTYLPLSHYTVTVITGDRQVSNFFFSCFSNFFSPKFFLIIFLRWGAGTDSAVYITLYGANETSREILLDNAQNNFERGKTDIFGIETVHLGELSKIRIRSDGAGIGSDWFLDKVTIHSDKDNKDWYFLYGNWIDDKNGLSRDIPASGQDGVACLPIVKYTVDVTTGDRRGAGTDANVYITIYGDNGDSGKNILDGPGNNFERNKTDTFGIEAVDLGNVQKIRIGHDNTGFGPGWFLEKVVVTNDTTKQQWFFLCGKWFDEKEEDGQIEREISASGQDGKVNSTN
jgi:hypothetical protein